MPLLGQGALAIWNAVTEEAEEDFYRWHNTEHMPERVGVPGFLRGRRYLSTARRHDFFTLYETESVETIRSAPYLARLNEPTPWTRRVLPHFRDTVRVGCRVAGSWGRGQGGALLAVRLPPKGMPVTFLREGGAEAALALVRQLAGVIGVHVLEPAPETTRIPTKEKELRGQQPGEAAPDDPWVLLVEANDPELAESVERGPLARTVAQPGTVVGAFRLQFSLERETP
jgi:hypothetical protein